jgi:hypothetical protein
MPVGRRALLYAQPGIVDGKLKIANRKVIPETPRTVQYYFLRPFTIHHSGHKYDTSVQWQSRISPAGITILKNLQWKPAAQYCSSSSREAAFSGGHDYWLVLGTPPPHLSNRLLCTRTVSPCE